MADPGDGLDQLNQRMARGRRTVPSPRHPQVRTTRTPSTQPDPEAAITPGSETVQDPDLAEKEPRTSAPAMAPPGDPVPADEAQLNLAVRVRRSLDLRLDELLHQLRREGVRSSKAELIEMLLWELPTQLDTNFQDRLRQFRRVAARR